MIVEVTKGVSDRQTLNPPSSPHHSSLPLLFFFSKEIGGKGVTGMTVENVMDGVVVKREVVR